MCTVVAVALSAVGSILQGRAQQKAYESQAAAMEQNARIADMQATDAIQRGGREEGNLRRRARQIAGAQIAQAAASGLAGDSGSLADAYLQSATNMERDVATNAINHAKEAWGYNTQAANYRSQASGLRAAGKSAFMGGLLGAGTSLLSLATPNMFGAAGSKAASATPSDWYVRNTDWNMTGITGNYTFNPGVAVGGEGFTIAKQQAAGRAYGWGRTMRYNW